MILRWGDYAHSPGSVKLSIDREPVLNAGQVQVAIKESWRIQGMLYSQDGGATDINSQISALMAAYASGDKDLVLTMPDGATPTATRLLTSQALGGTRVVKLPSFPDTSGVERVNKATYEIIVEGEFPLSADFILLNFSEKLIGNGGGPIIGWLKPAVGSPVPQIIRQQDTYRVTQSGFAEGYLSYSPVPLPIWPGFLTKSPDIEYASPDKFGDGKRRFGVTWKYEFEADIPLIGAPNSW